MSAGVTLGPFQIVPFGYCHCGCGGETRWARGSQNQYLKGHHCKKSDRCPPLRDRKREYDRQRYLQTREERLAAVARWQRLNPEKVNAASLRSKHRRRYGRTVEDQSYAAMLRNDPCSYCGGPGGEVDHIDPVSAGGAVRWDNLTSACRSCNASKAARPLLEFLP